MQSWNGCGNQPHKTRMKIKLWGQRHFLFGYITETKLIRYTSLHGCLTFKKKTTLTRGVKRHAWCHPRRAFSSLALTYLAAFTTPAESKPFSVCPVAVRFTTRAMLCAISSREPGSLISRLTVDGSYPNIIEEDIIFKYNVTEKYNVTHLNTSIISNWSKPLDKILKVFRRRSSTCTLDCEFCSCGEYAA